VRRGTEKHEIKTKRGVAPGNRPLKKAKEKFSKKWGRVGESPGGSPRRQCFTDEVGGQAPKKKRVDPPVPKGKNGSLRKNTGGGNERGRKPIRPSNKVTGLNSGKRAKTGLGALGPPRKAPSTRKKPGDTLKGRRAPSRKRRQVKGHALAPIHVGGFWVVESLKKK